MTPGEYLDLERRSEVRSEFIDGHMLAMTRSSLRHSLVTGNFLGELSTQLRGRTAEVFGIQLRLKVSYTGLYTYPDIVAVCGEVQLEDEYLDTLLNPTVIAEVLSDSTEAYDRGEKFAHYRRLNTLCEYVLVSQDKIRIEHFRRRGAEWILSELSDAEAILHLESIDCHVPLATIYEKVNFSEIQIPQMKR